jgi:hypothetical protein
VAGRIQGQGAKSIDVDWDCSHLGRELTSLFDLRMPEPEILPYTSSIQ